MQIMQEQPVRQTITAPFEGIAAQERQEFRMRFKIANAAELKADEVAPVSAVFEKSGGEVMTTTVSWRGDDFYIDAPPSTISYTGDLKLLRIMCQSAHGNREVWP